MTYVIFMFHLLCVVHIFGFRLFQEHVDDLLGSKVKTMGYKPLLATSECISFAPYRPWVGGEFNLGCLVKMWTPLLSMVSPIPSYCRLAGCSTETGSVDLSWLIVEQCDGNES